MHAKDVISATGHSVVRPQPYTALSPTAALDPRGALARKLLEISFDRVQSEDIDTLVVRAFDAADSFYVEASRRDVIVPLPSYEEAMEVQAAAKAEEDARRKLEEKERIEDQ